MRHGTKVGVLEGNLYAGPTAGNTYLEAAFDLLRRNSFVQSNADPFLFIRHGKRGATFVAVAIDYVIASATNRDLLDIFFKELSTKYTVKRLGFHRQYLGWTIRRENDGALHESQPAAIQAVLAETKMADCNGKYTPSVDGSTLHPPNPNDKPATISAKQYKQILGEVRYIAHSTRLDIYYAGGRLASAAKEPAQRHWMGLKCLLRNLNATKNHGILFPTREATKANAADLIKTFSNSDHAGDTTDRKSINGVLQLYNAAPICCTSSKQKVHALSTWEAEYVAASTAAQQSFWLRRMLEDMRMLWKAPTPLYIDNMATIRIAKNTSPNNRRKYMDLRHRFLHAEVAQQRLRVVHIPSQQMLADALTKQLKRRLFQHLVSSMNVRKMETGPRTPHAK